MFGPLEHRYKSNPSVKYITRKKESAAINYAKPPENKKEKVSIVRNPVKKSGVKEKVKLSAFEFVNKPLVVKTRNNNVSKRVSFVKDEDIELEDVNDMFTTKIKEFANDNSTKRLDIISELDDIFGLAITDLTRSLMMNQLSSLSTACISVFDEYIKFAQGNLAIYSPVNIAFSAYIASKYVNRFDTIGIYEESEIVSNWLQEHLSFNNKAIINPDDKFSANNVYINDQFSSRFITEVSLLSSIKFMNENSDNNYTKQIFLMSQRKYAQTNDYLAFLAQMLNEAFPKDERKAQKSIDRPISLFAGALGDETRETVFDISSVESQARDSADVQNVTKRSIIAVLTANKGQLIRFNAKDYEIVEKKPEINDIVIVKARNSTNSNNNTRKGINENEPPFIEPALFKISAVGSSKINLSLFEGESERLNAAKENVLVIKEHTLIDNAIAEPINEEINEPINETVDDSTNVLEKYKFSSMELISTCRDEFYNGYAYRILI